MLMIDQDSLIAYGWQNLVFVLSTVLFLIVAGLLSFIGRHNQYVLLFFMVLTGSVLLLFFVTVILE